MSKRTAERVPPVRLMGAAVAMAVLQEGGGRDERGGRGEESSDSDAQEESSDSDAHGGVGHDTARSRMGPLLAREGAWDGEGGGGWLREGNGEGEGGGATVTRRAARAPT